MKLKLFIFFLFVNNIISAQNLEFKWGKSYGGINTDNLNFVVKDISDNFYLSGNLAYITDVDPDVIKEKNLRSRKDRGAYISKINNKGELIWANLYDGQGAINITSAVMDNFANLYVVGNFQGTIDFDGGPDSFKLTCNKYSNSFILKIDANGRLVWVKTNPNNQNTFISSIDIIDKKLVLLGAFNFQKWYYSFEKNDTNNIIIPYKNTCFVQTLDLEGKCISYNNFYSNSYLYAKDIKFEKNGTYLASIVASDSIIINSSKGEIKLNKLEFQTTTSDNSFWVTLRFDSMSDLLSANHYGSNWYYSFPFTLNNSNNNKSIFYTFRGETMADKSDNTTILIKKDSRDHLIKLDLDSNGYYLSHQILASGSLISILNLNRNCMNQYTIDLSYSDLIFYNYNDSLILQNSSYLSTCHLNLDTFFNVKDKYIFSSWGDIFILKSFEKCNSELYLFGQYNTIFDADPNKNKVFNLQNRQSPDIFIVNLGKSFTSIAENQNNLIKTFPNPASEILELDIKQEDFSSAIIYNFNGSKLYEYTNIDFSKSINISYLENGIYILVLTDNNGNKKSTKFTVLK